MSFPKPRNNIIFPFGKQGIVLYLANKLIVSNSSSVRPLFLLSCSAWKSRTAFLPAAQDSLPYFSPRLHCVKESDAHFLPEIERTSLRHRIFSDYNLPHTSCPP